MRLRLSLAVPRLLYLWKRILEGALQLPSFWSPSLSVYYPEMPNGLCFPANNKSAVNHGSVRAIMDPTMIDLVSRIMDEFWIIFNQNWATDIRQCSSGSTSRSDSIPVTSPTQLTNYAPSKYSRNAKDHPLSDGDKGQEPLSDLGQWLNVGRSQQEVEICTSL